jgi:hypothetical protein
MAIPATAPDKQHAPYVVPCPNPTMLNAAIALARQLLTTVNTRIQAAAPIVPEDPRLPTDLHQAYVAIFKVDPGNASLGQVQQIKENFRLLTQAIAGIQTFCVNDKHPMGSGAGQLGHDAFATPGVATKPVVYFLPAFFRGKNPPNQARTVIHELAHARLSIGHAGGEFLKFDGCSESPLRSFGDAIKNAYSYDAFVDCLGG